MNVLDETSKKTQLNSLNLESNGITCDGAKKIAQVFCIGLFQIFLNPLLNDN